MSFLPKLNDAFNNIPVKIPESFFCQNWQADSKIYLKMQKIQDSVFEIEEQSWRAHLSDFKIYHNATGIHTVVLALGQTGLWDRKKVQK